MPRNHLFQCIHNRHPPIKLAYANSLGLRKAPRALVSHR
ncbi:hypothetical protein CHK_1344 [Christensenella hongkongensis]|uniref:Uncharacterized protein n=1 Tax=Christensenella hongkongensis TaxID=270498 RepID=A0A0M2NKI2_9FIRM|nr:hypothetical protein CHK_1344 [Christensenella hongkongensis]